MEQSLDLQESNRNRKFPRYNVLHYEGFRSRLGMNSARKLVSFGEGGCGFYSVTELENDQIIPPRVLEIEFELDGDDPVHVKGEVIYVRPYNVGSHMVRYYGVQFNQACRSQTKSIARKMERLASQGEVIKA